MYGDEAFNPLNELILGAAAFVQRAHPLKQPGPNREGVFTINS